jgi:hypothetical protein
MPLAFVLALLITSACAHAQGASGMLPDPITAVQLGQYADLLNLSPQQRHALDGLHTAYREEFQRLREVEIEPWLQARTDGFATRAYARKQRDLLERIAVIDNRFFDSIIPILATEQIGEDGGLQRVRARRERERVLSRPGLAFWGSGFDVSHAMLDMSIAVQQHEAVDAILLPYERALTPLLNRLERLSFEHWDAVCDEFERRGFNDAYISDRANLSALAKISQPVWNVDAPKHFALIEKVTTLNREAIAALAEVLPPAASDQLQAAFLRRAYPEIEQIIALNGKSPLRAAIARDDLTEEQRAALLQAKAEFDQKVATVIKQLTELVDEQRRMVETVASEERRQKAREFGPRLEQAQFEIARLLGEASQRLDQVIGAAPVANELDPERIDVASLSTVWRSLDMAGEIDALLPRAITARDLAIYARVLELDADGLALMQATHAAYLRAYAEFKETYGKVMRDANFASKLGNARAADTARRGAIAALHTIDTAFFTELKTALMVPHDSPTFDRVLLARQRQWCNRILYGGTRGTLGPGGSFESMLDLSAMLHRMHDVDVRSPPLEQALIEYEKATAPLLQRRYELIQSYMTVDDQITQESVEEGQPSQHSLERAAEVQTAIHEVHQSIVEQNRATLAVVQHRLPMSQADRVRATYERLAWPRIYSDPSCAAPLLKNALALADLTPQQRSEVEAIAADYHAAYAQACRDMTTSVEGFDSPLYQPHRMTDAEHMAYTKRATARARLAFDRHELSMRVWQRLKGILTQDQATACGLWTSPPDGQGKIGDFGN